MYTSLTHDVAAALETVGLDPALYQNHNLFQLLGLPNEREQIPQVIEKTRDQKEEMEALEARNALRRRPLYPSELRPHVLFIVPWQGPCGQCRGGSAPSK